MTHHRRDVPGGLGLSLGLRVGGPLLGGGGGLPILFDWNPELAEALPGTSTFTRASIKQVLTTTDGTTFWYQEAKSGELPLDGLRRVENTVVDFSAYDDFDDASWVALAGATKPGDGSISMSGSGQGVQITGSGDYPDITPKDEEGAGAWAVVELTGDGTIDLRFGDEIFVQFVSTEITLTSTPTKFAVFIVWTSGLTTSNGLLDIRRSGGSTATTMTLHSFAVVREQNTQSGKPPPLFDPSVTYNAEIAGVQYFNTTNGNSVDGNGVVTEATGTTITGGGYLPEPAATNQLDIIDLTDASWTKSNCTAADDGVNSLGLNQYTIDVGTNTGNHRVFGSGVADVDGAGWCKAKAGTGRYLGIRRGGAPSTDFSVFDLVAGTITKTIGIDENFIIPLGDGWYLCGIYDTDSINFIEISFHETGTPPNSTKSWTGANETFLICHLQIEENIFHTSPIITSGSAVTRVADSLTDTTWPSEASAVIDTTVNVVIPGGTIDNQQNMLGFGDNSAHSFVISDASTARIFTGGINSFIVAASSYESERHGFGMSFQVNEGIVVDDEDNDNTDVTGTPSGGTIQIGLNSALAGVPGNYHRIRIYAQIQSVEELKALA